MPNALPSKGYVAKSIRIRPTYICFCTVKDELRLYNTYIVYKHNIYMYRLSVQH